jgi:hypothetical protein
MLEVHNGQGAARGRGLKGCPPHGPHVVDALKEAPTWSGAWRAGWWAQSSKTAWKRS